MPAMRASFLFKELQSESLGRLRMQGTVSLPNLTSLFLYSSRFSIVTLVCPRLDLLSVIVEPDTPPATIVHELRHLTQLTQLKALHLGYVQVDFLDLRPLKELR